MNHRQKMVSKSLQGEIIKATMMKNNNTRHDCIKYVAIKVTNKLLHRKKIALSTQSKMKVIVEEDIIKETVILQRINKTKKSIPIYICNYIEFFEDNSNYYLVLEYIKNETNLIQFVKKVDEYLKCGRMSILHWKSITKFILWQITTTIHWLHTHVCFI